MHRRSYGVNQGGHASIGMAAVTATFLVMLVLLPSALSIAVSATQVAGGQSSQDTQALATGSPGYTATTARTVTAAPTLHVTPSTLAVKNLLKRGNGAATKSGIVVSGRLPEVPLTAAGNAAATTTTTARRPASVAAAVQKPNAPAKTATAQKGKAVATSAAGTQASSQAGILSRLFGGGGGNNAGNTGGNRANRNRGNNGAAGTPDNAPVVATSTARAGGRRANRRGDAGGATTDGQDVAAASTAGRGGEGAAGAAAAGGKWFQPFGKTHVSLLLWHYNYARYRGLKEDNNGEWKAWRGGFKVDGDDDGRMGGFEGVGWGRRRGEIGEMRENA